MKEKKLFLLARKLVTIGRSKVIFQKLNFLYGFHWKKKYSNKRILFQANRKSVSNSRHAEFV